MEVHRMQKRAYFQFLGICLLAVGAVYAVEWMQEKSVNSASLGDAGTRSRLKDGVGVAEKSSDYKLIKKVPGKVQEGFTIVPVSGTAEILLLDNNATVVHSWPLDAERVRLLNNCNVTVLHGSKWGYRQKKWRDLKFSVIEYDWQSNPVWRYDTTEWTHHDILQRENGNYIFLKRSTLPAPEDFSVNGTPVQSLGIRSDSILEVNREKELVWQWHVHDHFSFDQCGWRGCDYLEVRSLDEDSSKFRGPAARPKDVERITDWSHTNTVTELPKNTWYAQGDVRFKPGNLLVIIRNFWTAYIIDKDSGAIVWNYTGMEQGGAPADGLVRGHDIVMIPEHLPGAGNLLVFDNGHESIRKFSRVLELNPVSKEIVWEYSDPGTFFSNAAGSAQRLANGNTLISEDKSGRVFEVTPEKEIVWDVRGPHRISRAHRYDPNYCPQLPPL